MPTTEWIVLFVINSIWWAWILLFNGARVLEGWGAFFTSSLMPHWSAEQIRLYALVIWIITIIYFIAGMIYPDIRVKGFIM